MHNTVTYKRMNHTRSIHTHEADGLREWKRRKKTGKATMATSNVCALMYTSVNKRVLRWTSRLCRNEYFSIIIYSFKLFANTIQPCSMCVLRTHTPPSLTTPQWYTAKYKKWKYIIWTHEITSIERLRSNRFHTYVRSLRQKRLGSFATFVLC